MTKNIDERKKRLIQEILQLKNEDAITKMEEQLKDIQANNLLLTNIKPIRKTVSIEMLKKEQNYKPIQKDEFFKLVEELNIEEPIEELLEKLHK